MDDKWSKRFSRLEALFLSKSFSVPVEPVQRPFIPPPMQTAPGSTSQQHPKKATQPVEAPGALLAASRWRFPVMCQPSGLLRLPVPAQRVYLLPRCLPCLSVLRELRDSPMTQLTGTSPAAEQFFNPRFQPRSSVSLLPVPQSLLRNRHLSQEILVAGHL